MKISHYFPHNSHVDIRNKIKFYEASVFTFYNFIGVLRELIVCLIKETRVTGSKSFHNTAIS